MGGKSVAGRVLRTPHRERRWSNVAPRCGVRASRNTGRIDPAIVLVYSMGTGVDTPPGFCTHHESISPMSSLLSYFSLPSALGQSSLSIFLPHTYHLPSSSPSIPPTRSEVSLLLLSANSVFLSPPSSFPGQRARERERESRGWLVDVMGQFACGQLHM